MLLSLESIRILQYVKVKEVFKETTRRNQLANSYLELQCVFISTATE